METSRRHWLRLAFVRKETVCLSDWSIDWADEGAHRDIMICGRGRKNGLYCQKSARRLLNLFMVSPHRIADFIFILCDFSTTDSILVPYMADNG